MSKWLAQFQKNTPEKHDPCTDITDSTHKKYVTSVLSVRNSPVNYKKNQRQDDSELERWNPELAADGYVWCQDCQHFNSVNCNHPDNPFRTVEKQPAVPRLCQWYEVKLNPD